MDRAHKKHFHILVLSETIKPSSHKSKRKSEKVLNGIFQQIHGIYDGKKPLKMPMQCVVIIMSKCKRHLTSEDANAMCAL